MLETGWSFNEGGADCPPKEPPTKEQRKLRRRFNEGGADCPPKATTKLNSYWLFSSLQ